MCRPLNNIKGKTAKELLEMCSISMDEAPVDLTKLLKELNISARGVDFTEIEEAAGYSRGEILGAAIADGDNFSVFFRSSDSENRQRFTIAHEIAHCCIHTESLKEDHVELRASFGSNDPREIEANTFAGELLIPEELLIKMYNKLLSPSLKTLADIFAVSTNVMAARLTHLKMPYLKDTEYTYA